MQTPDPTANSITKQKQEIYLLKQDYETEFHKLEKEYINKLSEIEKIYKQQLEAERNILLNSWRWRIGNFQVNLILALRDFFLNIISLISRTKYKIAGSSDRTTSQTNNRRVEVNQDSKTPTLACIFDTFTHSCFQPEFNIISPSPDNWKYILRKFNVDALFCESAWAGNKGSYRFLIGDIGGLKKKGLSQMVESFRKKGIPTIFWNKEDPVHFDHFIDDARLFDFIFTTDQNIIPKYKEMVNHDRIFPLPFAAQEKIHNPVRTEERKGSVCFAGTWYAAKYAERIIDMETILNPAMDFGLEIFDRNYGATRYEKVMYGFPDSYQPFIKGKLDYTEMVKAYKNYKVFLNVNSVRYSPTMFSRRVFELLASGTPVISTWSEGIVNLLGEDIVLFTDSQEGTRKHLEKLLTDELFWWRQSLNGLRRVMENHTYSHRTEFIFNTIGLDSLKEVPACFLLVAPISSMEDAQYLANIIKKQHYTHFEIIIIQSEAFAGDPYTGNQVQDLFNPFDVDLIQPGEEQLLHAISTRKSIDFIAFLSADHYYGPNYLLDFSLAVKYSSADILGKRSCFEKSEGANLNWLNKGSEYQFCNRVYSASLVCAVNEIEQIRLSGIVADQIITHDQSDIFAIDPFNFILNGRQIADSIRQTIDL